VAQPVNRADVLLGKYLGLEASLLGALALGFGLSAIIIAGRGGQTNAGAYGLLVVFAFTLALGMLSLGFLISVLARKAAVATGSFYRRFGLDGHDAGFQVAHPGPVPSGPGQPFAGVQNVGSDEH
jgi:hypothetical protein